jgi:hypothetical protein
MVLGSGSPAIDAGSAAWPETTANACADGDQRGYVRAQDGDGNGSARCDIGAFENNSPVRTTYVSDAFTRIVKRGWRRAPLGGRYAVIGGKRTDYSVYGDAGRMRARVTDDFLRAVLVRISARDVEGSFRFKTNKVSSGAQVGGGQIVYLLTRRVRPGTAYVARVRLPTDGTVRLQGAAEVNGVHHPLGPEVVLPGVSQEARRFLRVRAQAVGINPTTVRMKAWVDGAPEPSTWQFVGTDSTPELQAPGEVGLRTYLGAEASNAPVSFTFDDFLVQSAP